MSKRHLVSLTALPIVIGLVSLAAVEVGAQTAAPAAKRTAAPAAKQATAQPAKPATAAKRPVPRTADGQPDLQGTWSYATLTPLERPEELAGKQTLTDEDVAAAEAEAKELATEKVEKRKTRLTTRYDTTFRPGDVGFYNQPWLEQGKGVLGTRQTSLIVDPPDGKIPAYTAEGARRAAAFNAARRRSAGPEDRSPVDRCIVGLNEGPPMVPGAYNNNVQLFQAPGYVAILNEMVHATRIIPLDGRPHGTSPQWLGDSRGRWDGDTLVIDTINYRDEGLGSENPKVQNASRNLHLVERFKRIDADTILYQFTVDDPTVYTKPWTASFTMTKSEDRIFEYACHEGNHAMSGILGGARADEKKTGDEGSRKDEK